MAAYNIGEQEAAAASNLLYECPPFVGDQLLVLARTDVPVFFLFGCRKYSMHKVIHHDGIAAGVLNLSYTGGKGALVPWKVELSNCTETLQLISNRIVADYESMAPKMRKALGVKDLDPWVEQKF